MTIINKKSDSISANVEGLEGFSAAEVSDDGVGEEVEGDDLDSIEGSKDAGNRNGLAIGVGIGSTVAFLIIGFFLKKNRKMKKELPRNPDHIEFFPNAEFLPKVQLRSDQQGVEMYPEDFDFGEDQTNATDIRNVKIDSSVESHAEHPSYEASFPISQRISRDPYMDSDSSEDDMPTDEESETRPISVRKKASYRVRNTVEI